ncbi:MAG TPA: hypothetical protein ENK18_09385 [Deltaproteobacteria bacterium]|nr:hypothetical protein [Deltaproteobacteria bacterium]
MDELREHSFSIGPLWAIRWPLMLMGNAAALLLLSYVLLASGGGDRIPDDFPDRFVELEPAAPEVEHAVARRISGNAGAGEEAKPKRGEGLDEVLEGLGELLSVQEAGIGGGGRSGVVSASSPPPSAAPDPALDLDPKPEPSGAPGAVRRWFPDSFLWRPLVETGPEGVARLEVTLPDQLTTWRILALAHDRQGQQAGTVHTVATELPVYVDPVVPGWLFSGDQLQLPVATINTSSDPLEVQLELSATGAMSGEGRISLSLGPGASVARVLPLRVDGAGASTIRAELSAGELSDTVQRQITALPAGRPVVSSRGTTLSGERTLEIPGPAGADPATEELTVVVFPGPLAVLAGEIERLETGVRPRDGGYGFALASRVRALATAAGIELDEAILRRIQLVAWQRIVRQAVAPDPGQAVDLLAAVAEVPAPGEVGAHEPAYALRERLQRVVIEGQRADGTWSREASGTLQRVLVDTAAAAWALPAEATGAHLRASGAVERYAASVHDGYTAATLLAAGLGSASMLEVVEQGLARGEDGAFTVRLPPDVLNPWGQRPSHPELLAWTVLALPGDHKARGDLVSELMAGWDAGRGFGAGSADVVALTAVARALPVVAQQIDLSLSVGGAQVATARLDPTQPRVPAVLIAPPGDGVLSLEATPPIAGLAVVATRRSWVPWSDADLIPGVDLDVELGPMAAGQQGTMTISVAAPAGSRLVLEQGLPAGAVLGPQASSIAQAAGVQLEVYPDRIVLETRALQPGEILELELPVSPAFAGRFQTAPLQVSVDGGPRRALAPATWQVSGG